MDMGMAMLTSGMRNLNLNNYKALRSQAFVTSVTVLIIMGLVGGPEPSRLSLAWEPEREWILI